MMKTLALVAALALTGCAGFDSIDTLRQDASAGLTGCPPRSIAISNNERLTWTATCGGQVFQCSTGDGTSCTRMVAAQ